MPDPSSAAPANLFADYSPRDIHDCTPLAGMIVRPSTLADRDALAQIAWQRNGGELTSYIDRFQRDLSNVPNALDSLWLSAQVIGVLVGYGKVSYFTPAKDAPTNSAPKGYYLGGVTVAPEFRRRGIAFELTRQRLAWIARRAGEAYYFANALNRASIDLHARFGFVELTRNFHHPSASFIGGIGILFRVDLRGPNPSPIG